jgi:hypothetical protein
VDSLGEQRANGQVPQPQISAAYVSMLNAALAIASTRVLTLVTLLSTIGMFGYAAYDPIPMRLVVVGMFGGLVLLPMVWALIKKG